MPTSKPVKQSISKNSKKAVLNSYPKLVKESKNTKNTSKSTTPKSVKESKNTSKSTTPKSVRKGGKEVTLLPLKEISYQQDLKKGFEEKVRAEILKIINYPLEDYVFFWNDISESNNELLNGRIVELWTTSIINTQILNTNITRLIEADTDKKEILTILKKQDNRLSTIRDEIRNKIPKFLKELLQNDIKNIIDGYEQKYKELERKYNELQQKSKQSTMAKWVSTVKNNFTTNKNRQ